ncbi:amidophosphoribosyltransferase, partial [Candidatus Sumerlaeota bacterium]|nr:amidophosphoribosyltransferase [Candidatus Sumerlaeota bacterium]
PWKHPCFFGIDTPNQEELIGSRMNVEETAQYIGADTLAYLSEEGLLSVFKRPDQFCLACFNGKYPGGHPGKITKEILEKV